MRRGLTLLELVVVVGIILILVALVTTAVSSVISRAEERKTRTGMALLQLAISEYESSTGQRLTLSPASDIPDGYRGRPYDMRRSELHCLTSAEITKVLLRHGPSANILGRINPSLIGVVRLDGGTPPWVPSGVVQACSDPDPLASSAQVRFNAFISLPYDPVTSPYTGLNSLVLLDSWGSAVRVIHPGTKAPLKANGELDTEFYRLSDFGDQVGVGPDPDSTVSRRVEQVYLGQGSPNAQIQLVSGGPDLKFGDQRDPVGECFKFTLDNVISGEVEK